MPVYEEKDFKKEESAFLNREDVDASYIRKHMPDALHRRMHLLMLHRKNNAKSTENIASIKSNENVGLEIEGKLKQQIFKDGVYIDAIRMGITRTRYLKILRNNK